MNIIEIAEGTITIELQPEEAMDIARACGRVVEMLRPIEEAKEHEYRLYTAIFEALAVAGDAQYNVAPKDEATMVTLSALRVGGRKA